MTRMDAMIQRFARGGHTARGRQQGGCLRCGADDETLIHRYSNCPANADVDGNGHTWVKKSQWVVELAEKDHWAPSCYWLRGLVPTSLVGGTNNVEIKHVLESHGAGNEWPWQGFTDGAGGPKHVMSELRRVGSGAV